jgi:hypothetical protein
MSTGLKREITEILTKIHVADCECSGPEDCYIEVQGNTYTAAGTCPEGEMPSIFSCPIRGTQETLICCECVPADECRANPEGLACEMIQCPEPGLACQPTCVRVTREGKVEVIDCDCLPPDSCYLQVAGDAVSCVHGSGCSPEGCKEIRSVDEETGETIICCACIDKPQLCAPSADHSRCDSTSCVNPGDPRRTCLPTRVLYELGAASPQILDCECIDIDDCHVDLQQSPPDCAGNCPPGEICKKTETPVVGSNLVELTCECVPSGVGQFARGDTNNSHVLDLSDAVRVFNWLFLGGAEPLCLASADTNGDGKIDLSDGIRTLGFLFLGTAAPVAPFPGCGLSQSESDALLGCKEPSADCGG